MLAELFSYEFMRHAFAAGLLASVLCGVIGTFVVVRRLVFISGGISHAAFGGLGAFYYFGLPPVAGAVLVALGFALSLGASESARLRSQDALIGVLWAAGMAVGIVFIYKTPGYAPNLMTYLFGDILTVTLADVYLLAAVGAAVLLFAFLFYKEFVAVSFDPTFAQVQGVPVKLFHTLLLALVALSIVVLIQVVGIILVIALLTIPPVISLMFLRDFVWVLVASVIIGMAMTAGGLLVSYAFDVPSGPAIVLLGTVVMGAAAAVRRLLHTRKARSAAA